jgi:hypothetical protein
VQCEWTSSPICPRGSRSSSAISLMRCGNGAPCAMFPMRNRMYGRPAQSTRYASRLTSMSSPNQRTYSCESAWQPIHMTRVVWKVVSRCSRLRPSRSASLAAMTADRSTCSAG